MKINTYQIKNLLITQPLFNTDFPGLTMCDIHLYRQYWYLKWFTSVQRVLIFEMKVTYQQTVSVWWLERVFAELADEFSDGKTVILPYVIQKSQGMVLKEKQSLSKTKIIYFKVYNFQTHFIVNQLFENHLFYLLVRLFFV